MAVVVGFRRAHDPREFVPHRGGQVLHTPDDAQPYPMAVEQILLLLKRAGYSYKDITIQ